MAGKLEMNLCKEYERGMECQKKSNNIIRTHDYLKLMEKTLMHENGLIKRGAWIKTADFSVGG